MCTSANTISQPTTSETASIGRRRTAAKIAVAAASAAGDRARAEVGHDLGDADELSMEPLGRSAAQRSIRGSPSLSTMSPSRKNENAADRASASSVVSSRPRLPGVSR